MNKKAGKIFNRDPKKIIGKHIWTEFPEGVGQPFHYAYEKAMKEQQYVYQEEYYPPYDKWFENHIYPSPEGLTIYFRDITEKKKAEQEMNRIKEENDALINSISDILWSVSNNYTLIRANNAFIKGLQENGGYLIKPGENILNPEYFPDDYLKYWKEIYQKGLSGEPVITEVYTPQANNKD
jgi:PAS domain-containing protein